MLSDIQYKEDILKDGFEQHTIQLKDDYEKHVISTLVRRLSAITSEKAVLYIHGFNDYFFQKEMAHQFNDHHFNFYALDLRRYGRSYLPHQKFNDIRNIKDYFEEITKALQIIHEEGNKQVILFGHSTGGLIISVYAKDHSEAKLFDGVILNSPFFEFNKSWIVKKLIPLVASIGKHFPKVKISGGFTEEYGKYLNKAYQGEWNYDLKWKPNIAPKINLGWIRAIYQAQEELKRPFHIQQPVLVMHSEKSVTNMKDKEQLQTRDAILNVKDIKQISGNIKGDVEVTPIRGGLHDLILSQKEVRDHVYDVMFKWIDTHIK
ncbi:MAG: alpha/beta hydrolase [Bacteroidales bacterium]|jgi:alpha-beta hydrolase superfamily lysophospholipase|nr:alpha/beta hydrolase [Bacteroidales bacterium]